MSADRNLQNKALAPGDDKAGNRASVEPALDAPVDRTELTPSDQDSIEDGKLRVEFVHHHNDLRPGQKRTLPAAEANDLIAARVARLVQE